MTTDPTMSVEYNQMMDRLEQAERGSRTWKLVSILALLASLLALLLPQLRQGPRQAATNGGRARFSAVETDRLVLRDRDGSVAGGLEVDQHGTIRLVLGRPGGAAAFLESQEDGIAHLRLRGPNGGIRAAVVGGDQPAVTLSPDGQRMALMLGTSAGGAGSIHVTDASGRPRFQAP